ATTPAKPTTMAGHAPVRASPALRGAAKAAAPRAVAAVHTRSRSPRVSEGRSSTRPATAIPRRAQHHERSSPRRDPVATWVPMRPGSRRRPRAFRDERHAHRRDLGTLAGALASRSVAKADAGRRPMTVQRSFTAEPGFTPDFFRVREFLRRINAEEVL